LRGERWMSVKKKKIRKNESAPLPGGGDADSEGKKPFLGGVNRKRCFGDAAGNQKKFVLKEAEKREGSDEMAKKRGRSLRGRAPGKLC